MAVRRFPRAGSPGTSDPLPRNRRGTGVRRPPLPGRNMGNDTTGGGRGRRFPNAPAQPRRGPAGGGRRPGNRQPPRRNPPRRNPPRPAPRPPARPPAAAPDTTAADRARVYADLNAAYPWLAQLGLSPAWVQNLIAGAASPTEIVAQIRQTPQYRKRLMGNVRPDGSMRMSEGEYFRTEDSYRQLLNQYGFRGYDRPEQLVGFFTEGIDANELQQRLEAFRGIEQGGQAVKDAFYVYAGMNVSDDDLLASIVDPAAAQNLQNTFNQKVAQGGFDYSKWIARATAAGMGRVAAELRRLQSAGAVTGAAVQAIMNIRPDFAQQIMSAIYQGAGDDTSTLSLTAVLEAFQFAAIGAAANASGLDMPTLDRLREIRAAGVERAQAIEGYVQFGKNASRWSSAMQRARGMSFGQNEFERATFLGDAGLQRSIEGALAQEEAAGQSQGSFRFAEDPSGRFVQRGFGRPGF